MGVQYRKKHKIGRNVWINQTGTGASVSTKVGPVTVNSRGGVWVKLPGGMTYRGRWK